MISKGLNKWLKITQDYYYGFKFYQGKLVLSYYYRVTNYKTVAMILQRHLIMLELFMYQFEVINQKGLEMSKDQNAKKNNKKAPTSTMKEKKAAKREKKNAKNNDSKIIRQKTAQQY